MIIQKENVSNWAIDISNKLISKGEIKDIEVINQSIQNIVGTLYGERIFNLSFGCGLSLAIFDIQSVKSGEKLLNDVAEAIKKWETRIIINESQMKLKIDPDNHAALIEIPYVIKRTSVQSVFKSKIIT